MRTTASIVATCGAWLILLFTPLDPIAAQVTRGRSWYVAPDGRPTGSGTEESPLDLVTALSTRSPARPGDIVWLTGGVYRGSFDSHLRGLPNSPIIVRQVPGERAILDSNHGVRNAPDGALNLKVDGGYAWYWGFEVANSDGKRTSADATAFPTDLYRANGINVYASNVKIINVVIHDVENGMFVGDAPTNVEVNGVMSFFNGHEAPDTSWGHGIYVQNQSRAEPRLVRDTITAFNFSHGLHAYGGGDRGLNAIRLEGNISFQNGAVSRFGYVRNLLLGGVSTAIDAVVNRNYTYFARTDGENNVGWSGGAPGAIVTDNYFAGGRRSLVVSGRGLPDRMSGNSFYGLAMPSSLASAYPTNLFYDNQRPSRLEYFIRPNQYEPGRAHIVVYNWPQQAELSVDLASVGLRNGARFEIRDAMDYFGPPVVSDFYAGKPVTIPLRARSMARPVGTLQAAPPTHTLPEFGVFVVTPAYARPRR